MSDLIDREVAIRKIEPWLYSEGRGESEINMLRAVIDTLKNMTAVPRWVRCEEELPPPNKTVLVCKIWGDVNGEPHKVITMDSFTISPSDSVIAWMPLPEPPQEVQE